MYGRYKAVIEQTRCREQEYHIWKTQSSNRTIKANMKAYYPNNKTVYISALIKQKHQKKELNNLEFSCLQAMYYVSTTERQ